MIHFNNLFTHQKKAVELYPRKRYLAWEVGCGKTRASLAIAKHNSLKRVLIVAPRSAHLTWKEENQLFDLDLTVMTYESFRDKLDVESVKSFDLVVFDEAHRLSNPSTQWTRKALQMRKYIQNILMLSGTPADKLHKIFSQLRILTYYKDPMFNKFKSFKEFLNHYFVLDDYGKPVEVKSRALEEELRNWFHKHAFVVRRDDVVELPPLSFQDVRLHNGRNLWEEFLEELREELYGKNLEWEEFIHLLLGKFIAIYRKSSLTNEKLEYVIDFVSSYNDTVVFSNFKDLVHKVSQALKDKVYAITSETSKNKIIEALTKQDKPIVSTYLLSEGANLQRNYRNIIFASLPLSYLQYEQALGRVYRTGQQHKVRVFTLLQNDIDFKVKSIIERKQDIAEFLKRLPFNTINKEEKPW